MKHGDAILRSPHGREEHNRLAVAKLRELQNTFAHVWGRYLDSISTLESRIARSKEPNPDDAAEMGAFHLAQTRLREQFIESVIVLESPPTH